MDRATGLNNIPAHLAADRGAVGTGMFNVKVMK